MHGLYRKIESDKHKRHYYRNQPYPSVRKPVYKMRAVFCYRISNSGSHCTGYSELYQCAVGAECRHSKLRVYNCINHYGIILAEAHYSKRQQKRCKAFDNIRIDNDSVRKEQRHQQNIENYLRIYREQCRCARNYHRHHNKHA